MNNAANTALAAAAIILDVIFVHFTDAAGAAAIVASGELRAGNFGKVYAVAAGGNFIPEVQHTAHGVATARDHAVIFRTAQLPNWAYAEEIVWINTVTLIDAEIVDAADAISLLDGSMALDEDELEWGESSIVGVPTV